MSTVPRWIRATTLTSVSVVAAVAAVASYVHMHELADRAGEEWRSILVPLSVDGLLVAASMVLFIRRREGQRAGVMPWLGVVLGIGASLLANIAAGWDDWHPAWLSGVVAAWPPVALAISFELLIDVLRSNQAAQKKSAESWPTRDQRDSASATAAAAPEPAPTADEPEPAPESKPAPLAAVGAAAPWSGRAKQLMKDGVPRATAYRRAQREHESVSA